MNNIWKMKIYIYYLLLFILIIIKYIIKINVYNLQLLNIFYNFDKNKKLWYTFNQIAKVVLFMEEKGVWRTVGGRRIFIKEGQDLASAMKESGKFPNKQGKEETLKKELQDIQDDTIKEYEDEVFDVFNLEQYSAEEIRKSKLFDSGIEENISKVAFEKNYEITTQEMKQIKDNIYKEYDKRRNELLGKKEEPSKIITSQNKIQQLENEAQNLKTKFEETSKKMQEYVKYAIPSDTHDETKRQEYYKFQKQYWKERNEYNDKLNQILEERNKTNNNLQKELQKVNGYGEATSRNITSTTYERAIRRTQRDVEKWLGIK